MKQRYLLIVVIIFLFLNGGMVLSSTTNGTIDSVFKYAWADGSGWINFGLEAGDVHITNSEITGYAWSDNYGWINLSPTNSGVRNNGEGILSGYAWGENIGWVDFSNVAINSSGEFTGTATGDIIGAITFDCTNCSVKTDWRPQICGDQACNGLETCSSCVVDCGACPPPPQTCGDNFCNGTEECSTCEADCGTCPATEEPQTNQGGGGTFYRSELESNNEIKMMIDGGVEESKSAEVSIKFFGWEKAEINLMSISNDANFSDAVIKNFQEEVKWILSRGDGEKIVYVRLFDSLGGQKNLSDRIILNTRIPDLVVNQEPKKYLLEEDTVISGKTDANASVVIKFNEKVGMVKSDQKGNWSANIGKLNEGKNSVKVESIIKNKNSRSSTIDLNVVKSAPTVEKEKKKVSFWDYIKSKLGSILSFNKKDSKNKIIIIPQNTPASLSGQWNFINIFTPKIKE